MRPHPGVVSGRCLIEKEAHGGSLRRKAPLKSPGVLAEESQWSVVSRTAREARYSQIPMMVGKRALKVQPSAN